MRRLPPALLLLALVFAALASTAQAGYVVSAGSDEHFQLGTGYKTRGSSTVFVSSTVGQAAEVCGAGWWGVARMEDGSVLEWGGNEMGQSGTGTRTTFHERPVVVPGLTNVTQIACSGEHVVVLFSDGTVAGWGSDGAGQQCDGVVSQWKPETSPYRIPGLTGVKEVAAGGADTWFLLANGTVEGCGEDTKGQLGDGVPAPSRSRPVQASISGVRQISGGGFAVGGADLLTLMNTGTVEGVGWNTVGQLGDGTRTTRATFAPVKGLSNVRTISTSATTSVAVTAGGDLYAWGDARFGELGAPGHSACGEKAHAGPCQLTPQKVPGIANVGLVHAAVHKVLATVEGRLFAWGANEQGQLGDGSKTEKRVVSSTAGPLSGVTDIAGEGADSFALTSSPMPTVVLATGLAGALSVQWTSRDRSEPWQLSIRPARTLGFPGAATTLPPSSRSYRFSVPPGEYEVLVRSAGWGAWVVSGSAL